MPAANAVQPISVRLTTTDGTATAGATFLTQVGRTYLIEARIVASDGTTSAAYGLVGLFEHTPAGTLNTVGTGTLFTAIEDIAAPMTAAFDTTGVTVRVMVTGDPGRSIDWNINLDIYPTVQN